MLDRRRLLIGLSATAALGPLARMARAAAAEPIRVGEINSYSAIPAFTIPYRHGWQLALDQINGAGGVLGRPIEVISRDDGGKPADAITAANELVAKDRVVLLMGTFLSNVGLAVSDFARQKGILFLAAEPLTDALIWEKGNRYTFRLRPSTSMLANMLAEAASKLPAKRWATIAPNYEYGRAAVTAFKTAMSRRRSNLEWVEEQWPPLFKLDGGPTVQALLNAGPDAIFNATFAQDLAVFVREGEARGLFQGREVVSMLTGEPEYLDPLGAEAPRGWIVTGYPWYAIDTPEHEAFLSAYRARVNDYPRLGSVVGYSAMKSVAAILARAGSTETDRLIAAAEGVHVETPFGPIVYRPEDHQSTMGAYVGRTDVKNGKGIMVDWVYDDGANYLPSAAEVKTLRATE